jgi:hypothetical protein
MLVAMREKRERLLDDFKHGIIGSERLKRDPVVSFVANQTGSPGAVQQIGIGDFSQSALQRYGFRKFRGYSPAANHTTARPLLARLTGK